MSSNIQGLLYVLYGFGTILLIGGCSFMMYMYCKKIFINQNTMNNNNEYGSLVEI